MATDFGIDVNCVTDLDPTFGLVSGQLAVGQAVARRLITQRGTLADDSHYGSDVRAYFGEPVTGALLARIKTDVEREATQDERVLTASASVSYAASTQTITIALVLATADEVFRLVFTLDSAGLTLLTTSA